MQSTFGTKCLRNGGNMGELMQQYIDEAEQDLLHTYNRYQVVLDRGDGVSLYDIEGKRYLDFVAGIAVFALGYHNAGYNDALKAQIDKVIHTSNYYYNVPAVEAARHLKKVSRMDRVFFTNSGAEAIEGAINRDIGKCITVNYMMAKDSVKKRFSGEGDGMSFTEFTYQLVQGFDFLHLYQTMNCKVQLGGADQW